MKLKAKNDNKDYPKAPAGVHRGCIIGIYDIGTHHNSTFDKDIRQILFVFELTDENIEINGESKPMAVSKKYTASLSEKSNLRKDIQAMLGRNLTNEELEGFDPQTLIGQPLQVQIVHSEDGKYANVATLMQLPKAMPVPKPVNPLRYFSLDESHEIPEGTPEWIQNLIKESKEYKSRTEQAPF